MKTIVAVAVTALVCTASGFATGVAVTPGQFNALKNRVTKLEKSDKAELTLIATCFNRWTGFTSYSGYVAQDQSNQQLFVTSAVDITGQGQAPQFYLPTSGTDCTLNLRALGIKPVAAKIGPVQR
jgi:hypothetical protein